MLRNTLAAAFVLAVLPMCSSSPANGGGDSGPMLDGSAPVDAAIPDVAVSDDKPATCGNNVTDPGEACDGTDLNGFTTVDQLVAGYRSGTLACRSDCLGYDISQGVAGGTVNATSCSSADVQTALDGAHHGDTVMVPPGTCTWSTAVTLDATARSLALRGAGVTQTIINVGASNILSVSTAKGFTFGLSGMQLAGTTGWSAVISISGTAQSWRVHDLSGNAAAAGFTGPFIQTYGATYGVIDHVHYTGVVQMNFAQVNDANWASWQQPLSLGRASAVYFEDDTVDFTGQHDDVRLIAVQNGGRMALRHSAITNFVLAADGLGSSTASALQVEVYDNQIAITDPTNSWSQPVWPSLVYIGGGTSVWFDNTFTVDKNLWLSGAVQVDVLRAATGNGSFWGTCDGTPRGVCSNVGKDWSTISGGGAMPCAQDSDCGTGQTCKWKLCSVSKTQLCSIDDDCPTSETCTGHLDGPTTNKGYPCFMQPGFGTEMESAPVQLWNNQITGTTNIPAGPLPIAASSTQVVAGRDWVTTADPKYVPYVYPHPLVQLGP